MLLAFIMGAAVAIAEMPPCPAGEGWAFVPEFSDEFSGTQLDTNKWWDFNPDWYGRKPAFFLRDNVSVSNGCLRLAAKAQKPEDVTVENRVRGYDLFTTATVKSKKKVLYGYLEARCKGMRAGVCNAFWLYDPLQGNPEKYRFGNFSEEIDIFEFFGKPADPEAERVYYTTVHRMLTPYVESIANSRQFPLKNKDSQQRVDFDFWADFHVYAFKWTPEEMVWYLDGREMFRRENDYYKAPLHIMFDCEVMRNWVGNPDPGDLPATFCIDYLHVWQRK